MERMAQTSVAVPLGMQRGESGEAGEVVNMFFFFFERGNGIVCIELERTNAPWTTGCL